MIKVKFSSKKNFIVATNNLFTYTSIKLSTILCEKAVSAKKE